MKLKKTFLCLFIAAILLFAIIPVSAASGSSYVSVSDSEPNVGDSITVSITVSASDGYIFGAEGDLSYNSSVLQYDGGSDSSGGGGNAHFVLDASGESDTSISTSISFKVIGSGSSGLSVSISEAFDPDINVISVSGSSASVNVAGGTQQSESEHHGGNSDEDEEESKEEEKKPEIIAQVDDVQYKLWDNLEGVELPDGYGSYIFKYKDVECTGAIDSASSTVIAYLENTKTQKSSFFVYNSADETFIPFVPVKSVANTYLLYPLPKGMTVPEIFDIEVDNFGIGGIPAWESSDSRLSNTVLFFGADAKGIKGFYLYDKDSGSVSRFLYMNFLPEEEKPTVVEPEEEPTVKDAAQSLYAKILDDQRIFIIIAILSALCIGLLIALIFSIAFKKVSRVDKEKFRKKMEKKKNRVTKRAEKYMSVADTQTPEIEIETENFDEIPDEATGDIVTEIDDDITE